MNSFLIISGQIAKNRKAEFEQTFSIGLGSMSKNCMECNLSEDANKEGLYYFFSRWSDEKSLKIFQGSREFQLLSGAFYALGSATKSISGNVNDG